MTMYDLVEILSGRKMVEYMGTIYEVIAEYSGGVILQDVICVDYSINVSIVSLYCNGSVYERR